MSSDLPEGWECSQLKDVAVINPTSLSSKTEPDRQIRYISIEEVSEQRISDPTAMTFSQAPSRARRVIAESDILVGTVRPYLRAFATVPSDLDGAIASTGFAVIRPTAADADFLFQLVLAPPFVDYLTPLMKGSNYPAVTAKDVEAFPVSLPPLPEQRKIAEILSSVDEAIRATEAVIEQTEKVKQATLKQLLTKGIGHTRFKQTEIGEIPKSWEVARIGDIAKVKGGKRMPKGRPFADYPTPHPYIRVTDFEHGSVSELDLKFVSPEDQKSIARYTISSDDLYISIAGTIGLVGEIPEQLNGAQLTENAAKIASISQRVRKTYLRHFLASASGQRQISVAKGIGGGVPKLALFRIENIQLPVPSLAEQDQIVDAVASFEDTLSTLRQECTLQVRMKTILANELLSARKRVAA